MLDFNGDGKADVAVYNANSTIGYLGVADGAGTTKSPAAMDLNLTRVLKNIKRPVIRGSFSFKRSGY